jgi:hypothetical protein
VNLEDQTECVLLPELQQTTTSYTPPFSYSYQCASSLLTSYVPVFIYSYTISGVLIPALFYMFLILDLNLNLNSLNLSASASGTVPGGEASGGEAPGGEDQFVQGQGAFRSTESTVSGDSEEQSKHRDTAADVHYSYVDAVAQKLKLKDLVAMCVDNTVYRPKPFEFMVASDVMG